MERASLGPDKSAMGDTVDDRPGLKAAMRVFLRAFLRSVQRRAALVAAYFQGEHVTDAAA